MRLEDGREFRLRPIRPEDEPLLQDMLDHSTAEDIRLRFFTPLKRLTHEVAARLSQIDYDREMALVAEAPDPEGTRDTIWGVVRIAARTRTTRPPNTASWCGPTSKDTGWGTC